MPVNDLRFLFFVLNGNRVCSKPNGVSGCWGKVRSHTAKVVAQRTDEPVDDDINVKTMLTDWPMLYSILEAYTAFLSTPSFCLPCFQPIPFSFGGIQGQSWDKMLHIWFGQLIWNWHWKPRPRGWTVRCLLPNTTRENHWIICWWRKLVVPFLLHAQQDHPLQTVT